ncbi:hypothetical protein ACJDU8_17560 [Clostridium sp. WILCCON 0269]|uniref:Uncharacterized protein n=1 Tax=Candidatus Clostridium eludens TaxID=3381663 RepID=A0ABW8SNP3_9CLOT
MNLRKLSIDNLKNAIWTYNNGMVPIGGLDVEEYRNELIRRGEDGKGYHESEEDNQWRRFEIINKENEKQLLELLDSKSLTREDLMLILSTIKIRLKSIPTQELVKELENRKEIEKISVGMYAPYELRKKYFERKSRDKTCDQIDADTALVIPRVFE